MLGTRLGTSLERVKALCHPEEPPDAYFQAGLFAHLTSERLCCCLAQLHAPTRRCPEIVDLGPVQKHPVSVKDYTCCSEVEDGRVWLLDVDQVALAHLLPLFEDEGRRSGKQMRAPARRYCGACDQVKDHVDVPQPNPTIFNTRSP